MPTAPPAAADPPAPVSRPRQLVRYFLNGLIALGPLALTVYICVLAFRWVDGWLHLPVPGAGFVVTVALVTLLGWVASGVVARGAFGMVDRALARLPFVRLLYGALRDVFGAFAGDRKRFTMPVSVELAPGTGVRVFGFLTQPSLEAFGMVDQVAVYLPQSYNFAGQTVVVPRERVTPVDARPADVLAFIVSGGISLRDHHATADAART
ncbi:MAG TPA: DUF502 domain-containing protein [Gemmatimonadales bacterium]|nr:DUF502 domain-containing protein [Gemmatimonadales bacterium]